MASPYGCPASLQIAGPHEGTPCKAFFREVFFRLSMGRVDFMSTNPLVAPAVPPVLLIPFDAQVPA